MYGYGYFNSFKPVASGAVPIDADAQAFITAASITDATQKSAVNQLVLDLKAASLWTKADLINPYIGGSATSHRYNLKNAATDTIWYGGITHNSNGVSFNGSTGYGWLNYGATALNQYNRSHFQYIRSVTTDSTKSWQGTFDGTNVFGFQAANVSSVYKMTGDGLNRLNGALNITLNYGLLGVSVNASNSAKSYNGGTAITTINNPNGSPTNNLNYHIGSLNQNGNPVLYGDHNTAFDWFGSALNDSEVTALNNAVVTFQTTLGRNV